jgi:hypothetical protein
MEGKTEGTSSDANDKYFRDTISEEDIERIKMGSGVEDGSLLPFKGQTYTQLILTYVTALALQIAVYFALPFVPGFEEVFLFESGGDGLRMRRWIGAVSSFVTGIYFVVSTIRAKGVPKLNLLYAFFPPLIFGTVHLILMESGKPAFAVPGSVLGLVEPSRFVTILYMSLPHVIMFLLLKYTVELWIRLDDDNLRKAIEWENNYLGYPYFSDREIAKRVTNENGDNDDTA